MCKNGQFSRLRFARFSEKHIFQICEAKISLFPNLPSTNLERILPRTSMNWHYSISLLNHVAQTRKTIWKMCFFVSLARQSTSQPLESRDMPSSKEKGARKTRTPDSCSIDPRSAQVSTARPIPARPIPVRPMPGAPTHARPAPAASVSVRRCPLRGFAAASARVRPASAAPAPGRADFRAQYRCRPAHSPFCVAIGRAACNSYLYWLSCLRKKSKRGGSSWTRWAPASISIAGHSSSLESKS